LGALYEFDAEPDPADAEVLQSLMTVGSWRSSLEFLTLIVSPIISPSGREAASIGAMGPTRSAASVQLRSLDGIRRHGTPRAGMGS
jgi:hypothetical protein